MNIRTLSIMGLMSMFGLGGCANAQIGKQVLNLDDLDYGLDVAHYYAPAMEESRDTAEEQMTFYVDRDTVKYYDTETDKLLPVLIAYRYRGGIVLEQATFCGHGFTNVSMATTEDGHLIMVQCEVEMQTAALSQLLAAAVKKYGEPYAEEKDRFGKPNPNPKYRWETKDEYIQLNAKNMSGQETLNIEMTGNVEEPVKIENPEPYMKVALYRWPKKYHDLVLAEEPLYGSSLDKEKEMRWDNDHIKSAQFYTPEEVKPFFITAHYLDSLEHSDDVWGKIEASFYYRIPNSKVTDETGITDSVKINQEGCLPCWSFGSLDRNFKDGLSNAAYIARQMQKGVKFAELMEDKELCPDIYYYGEAEWWIKKKVSGIVRFERDEKGNMVLRDSETDRDDIRRRVLIINDNIKEELRKSGLDLEHTTVRLMNAPGDIGTPLAFFTDGKLEMFMYIHEEGYSFSTPNHEWDAGKVYRLYDYLSDIK